MVFKWLFKYVGLEVNPKDTLLVLGQTQKDTVPFGKGLARTLLMEVYFPKLSLVPRPPPFLPSVFRSQ